jgi:hypothetical protein
MLWNDQRRDMLDVAKRACAADACMLAHGLQPKRIVRTVLNRATA